MPIKNIKCLKSQYAVAEIIVPTQDQYYSGFLLRVRILNVERTKELVASPHTAVMQTVLG